MSQSGEQLNHAIKNAWSADEYVPPVEERYLKLIQALIAKLGGEVTIEPAVFENDIDFVVDINSTGHFTLRTAKYFWATKHLNDS